MTADRRILVVDDHEEMVSLLADKLRRHDYEVAIATSGAEAIEAIRRAPPDVVVTDLRMEEVDGLDVLDYAGQTDPDLPVLIMTAFGEVDSAVEAMRRGADHYLTKPFQLNELLLAVERAIERRQLRTENRTLRRMADERFALDAIVGTSDATERMRALVKRVASAEMPVLILGESGTGKELVARAIHGLSGRRASSFVAVNSTAMPDDMLESELFGHTRGAFTGANRQRRGLFVEADGGTLFFDEIGDMPLPTQAKLLRVLEEGEVRPVGADQSRQVDVRVIAATHADLPRLVESGAFREDLFFRLNVLRIEVPALRDRPDDIASLTAHFLEVAQSEHATAVARRFSPAAMTFLEGYEWPGNVRQLANLIRRLAVLHDTETIGLDVVESALPASQMAAFDHRRPHGELASLREMEDEYIRWVIEQCDGNKTKAAEILGIDVSTIHRRRKRS